MNSPLYTSYRMVLDIPVWSLRTHSFVRLLGAIYDSGFRHSLRAVHLFREGCLK